MTGRNTPRYASVLIDVDSTLSRIEGIEWLAGRCDPAVRARITETTEAAMRGDIPLEAVYGERLALVRPTRDAVTALGRAYVDAISPDAADTIGAMRAAGVRVVLVSGGLRDAVLTLGRHLGVPDDDVHAVAIYYDEHGHYRAYDTASPLARRGGKPELVRSLCLPRPILAAGDGITDAELAPVVDTFVAFAGVVRHEVVVERAAAVVTTFTELRALVLP